MREIKFRVWDKYHKKFAILEISNKTSGCEWKQIPETVFDEFTGLHDKNGTEIYVGDKLKYSFETKGTICPPYTESNVPGYEIWEIQYISPSFVKIIVEQDNSYFGEIPSEPRVIPLNYLDALVVIGNIHDSTDETNAKECTWVDDK